MLQARLHLIPILPTEGLHLSTWWRGGQGVRRPSLRLLIALLATVLASLRPMPAALHAESSAPAGTESAAVRPQVVKVPDRESLWLIGPDGQRRWIADRQSLQAQGLSADDVELVSPSWLRQWPLGPALVTGSLWQDSQTGKVYLVAAGQRRWIPDLLTFSRPGLGVVAGAPGHGHGAARRTGRPRPALDCHGLGLTVRNRTTVALPWRGAAPLRA